MIKSVSVPALLGSLIFAGIAVTGAIDSRKVMTEKAQAQEVSVQDFSKWKAQYEKLLPVEQEWNSSIKQASTVKDLFSLHSVLGDDPKNDPDSIVVDRIEPFLLNEKPTGSSKVCFHSSTGTGMQFTGDKPSELVASVSKLAKRVDVSFSTMELSYDTTGKLTANLRDFCIILKD